MQLDTYAQVAWVLQHPKAHFLSQIIQATIQVLAQSVIIAPTDQVTQDHVLLDTIKIKHNNRAANHVQ